MKPDYSPINAPIPEEIVDDDIGTTFRKLRHKAGITQKEVAEAAGTDDAYVCRVETGKRKNMNISTLSRMFGALGLGIAVIKKNDVSTINDDNGVGTGFESGTIAAGVMGPMTSKIVEVKYNEEFENEPALKVGNVTGDGTKLMVAKHNKKGFVASIVNYSDKPQTVTAKWTAESK